ncbi:MAG: hypothetical protein NWE87_08330, partial [Candidatus Bathyarchaeota archaeon]|nr:hypothetical protein [Candidatus Bathyarchaeota archaeon]
THSRTVTTDLDGSYSDSYTPEVPGSWSVSATWEDVSSSSVSFQVKQEGFLTQWWFWTLLILAIGSAVMVYLLKTGKTSLQFKRIKIRQRP